MVWSGAGHLEGMTAVSGLAARGAKWRAAGVALVLTLASGYNGHLPMFDNRRFG